MSVFTRFGLGVIIMSGLVACTPAGGHTIMVSTENPVLLHGLQGKLLFISTQSDQSTIIQVKADGSEAAPLFADTTAISIQNRWQTNSLAWSLAGGLLFDSYQDGRWAIYLAQGETLNKLTNGMVSDLYPSWSPDGKQIIFTSYRDGRDELYQMNRDGSNVRRLTDGAGSEKSIWSPDGASVAFVSEREGSEQIYVMNPDGSNVRRLTLPDSQNIYPAWSPDGKQIAFTSDRDGNYEIYTMNADGSNVRRLTNNPADDLEPTWSPDGQYIAFVSQRDMTYQIYIMPVDGSQVAKIVHDGVNTSPIWIK